MRASSRCRCAATRAVPRCPALEALAAGGEAAAAELALPDLARLLRWGAGVVRTRTFPGGETYHFRTYSSAGALYPVEVYLACTDLPGLAQGLYHFHPLELALRPLRAGDLRGALAKAAAAPDLAQAAAVLLVTGILWWSAWKYGARAYRHLFWDAGTMLANLLALAASARLGPRLVTGFLDAAVNDLLGVGGEREAALALLALGRAERAAPAGELAPLGLEAAPLSPQECAYPEAHGLHSASSLATDGDVRRYRAAAGREGAAQRGAPEGGGAKESAAVGALSREALETVIRRRGSARDFTLEAVPASELAALLARAAAPIPADVPALTR